jgi:exopolysaccharide biosynthesis WecB/TagA/CpsF family protein
MKTKILYSHNGKKYKIKNILSWLNLLIKGEMRLCGISLHPRPVERHPRLVNRTPGIISLFHLSILNSVKKESSIELDRFFVENDSFLFKIKVIFGFLFNYMFYKNTNKIQKYIKIFGVNILNTDSKSIKKLMMQTIQKKSSVTINFLNANNLNVAYTDKDYSRILDSQNGQFLLADGSGVKIAAKLTGQKLRENLNGTDLFPQICKFANSKRYKFFLFGASEKVVRKLKYNIEQKYPHIQIVGCEPGFGYDNDEMIRKINTAKPDFLFVAMGTPIQEKWIDSNCSKLDVRVVMGVGGLFDFYAGAKRRAPIALRKLGLEWTYRLYIEPKRMWRRYILGNPLFIFRCLFF